MSHLVQICKRELFDGRDVWAVSGGEFIKNPIYRFQIDNPLKVDFTFFEDHEELISLCSSTPHRLIFRSDHFDYEVLDMRGEFLIAKRHARVEMSLFSFLSTIRNDEKWVAYFGVRSENFKCFGGKKLAFQFIIENLL